MRLWLLEILHQQAFVAGAGFPCDVALRIAHAVVPQGGEVVTAVQPTTGRIFVGNAAQFEGYTGGGDKERIGGLMSSGDVGHVDAGGRLYIDGRDDEMIVSGGENVFPAEIENLLAGHAAIADIAAIGVEDEQFGQRLKAFVVLRAGHELSEQEVKDYVRENLARYKVPEHWRIDGLPHNAMGKVVRSEVERWFTPGGGS